MRNSQMNWLENIDRNLPWAELACGVRPPTPIFVKMIVLNDMTMACFIYLITLDFVVKP